LFSSSIVLRNKNLLLVFYLDIQFSHQYLLKVAVFLSNVCLWHLCQELDGLSCVDIFPDVLFHWFTWLCFCATTTLFLLLWLCS
jgi:hypothetical protein